MNMLAILAALTVFRVDPWCNVPFLPDADPAGGVVTDAIDFAAAKGEMLRAALQAFAEKYDQVLDVRGLGLMLGMVVDGDPKAVVDAFRDFNVLALTAHGNVVRFLPTLSMSEAHIEEAVEMMGDALDGLWGAEA